MLIFHCPIDRTNTTCSTTVLFCSPRSELFKYFCASFLISVNTHIQLKIKLSYLWKNLWVTVIVIAIRMTSLTRHASRVLSNIFSDHFSDTAFQLDLSYVLRRRMEKKKKFNTVTWRVSLHHQRQLDYDNFFIEGKFSKKKRRRT